MSKREKVIDTIRRSIAVSRSVAVFSHVNPDGDSIGSMLALGLALRKMKKTVYMICQDEIPPNYKSLPGAGRIIRATVKKIDLAIAVDCSLIDLLGKNVPTFKKAKASLEIDHHEFRKSFGDIQLVDPGAIAAGELVYRLLKDIGVAIDHDIAQNLLASIIVETNLFKASNVDSSVFLMCSELIKTGVNFSRLVDTVYGMKTRQAMLLEAIALLRAQFLKKGKIIWSLLRTDDITRVGGKEYDADAIASEMNSMKGVKIAALFREKNRKLLRVSLRSRDAINVGKIAQRYKGGGHFDIAGCCIPNNARSISRLLRSLETLLDSSAR